MPRSGVASSGSAFLGPCAAPELLAHPAFWEAEAAALGGAQGQILVDIPFRRRQDTCNCPGLLALDPAGPARVARMDRLRGPVKRRPFCSTPESGKISKRDRVSLWILMAWKRGTGVRLTWVPVPELSLPSRVT